MPREVELTVPPELAGQRLDRLLGQQLPELTRSQARRLIDCGQVTIPGQTVKPSLAVGAGWTITIAFEPPRPLELVPEEIPLDIVYEDGDVVVVNKPAGLVVHPAPGHWSGTLVNALLAHCRDLSGIGGVQRPGIVHRLDRDTTGLIVAAKNDRAHRSLAAQLRQRTAGREYLALVRGRPAFAELVVDAPLARSLHDRRQVAVSGAGRAARTRLVRLASYPHGAVIEAHLETGRTHQVRVHCAHVGHPLFGDPVYGQRRRQALGPLPEPIAAAEAALPGQALHARRLTFRHPADGRELLFEAPPPAAFSALWNALAATSEP